MRFGADQSLFMFRFTLSKHIVDSLALNDLRSLAVVVSLNLHENKDHKIRKEMVTS